ncbi:glyoxalase superfamily protein [Glycomyces mayteni]|uniref:Bleomycin resistance protein n=1 Tax=Glycomyces mayteni TaxID=543887 RepID=A0ABW2D231_9ACTN|nr:glyoxalase superfamily protein [Glycomyces mayteni]
MTDDPAVEQTDAPIAIAPPVPILRIFSVEKAREFYVGYLGFAVAWEHRFEPDLPLYMQVERGAAVLHLSEHHGDGTPGTACFVPIRGIEAFHAELAAKDYPYARPGIEDAPWGSRTLTVGDPFGNTLRFDEAA